MLSPSPSRFLPVIAMALSIYSLASAQENAGDLTVGSDWSITDHRKVIPLSRSTTIEITNDWGDIWVRGGASNALVIEASVQSHAHDPRQFSFDLKGDSKQPVSLAPGFVEATVESIPNTVALTDELRRIDLGVRIPPGHEIHLSTTAGDVDVRELEGTIHVESESGGIRVLTAHPVVIDNRHGTVSVTFVEQPVECRLSTETGDLQVYFPRNAKFELTGSTRGQIASDYSMQVERDWSSGLKHFQIRVGETDTPLQLSSKRGNIAVVQTGIHLDPN